MAVYWAPAVYIITPGVMEASSSGAYEGAADADAVVPPSAAAIGRATSARRRLVVQPGMSGPSVGGSVTSNGPGRAGYGKDDGFGDHCAAAMCTRTPSVRMGVRSRR